MTCHYHVAIACKCERQVICWKTIYYAIATHVSYISCNLKLILTSKTQWFPAWWKAQIVFFKLCRNIKLHPVCMHNHTVRTKVTRYAHFYGLLIIKIKFSSTDLTSNGYINYLYSFILKTPCRIIYIPYMYAELLTKSFTCTNAGRHIKRNYLKN